MTTTPEARLLVVEDQPNIRELLATSLRFAGFEVYTAGDGGGALVLAEEHEPDLVVLDVMLPDMSGFTVTTKLREAGRHVPIVFLTARDAVDDRVKGLTIGGDDYITKPFSLEEVVARIRAVLRRTRQDEPEDGTIRFHDLELNEDLHEVRRAGKVIDCSPTEFNPRPRLGLRLPRRGRDRRVLHLLPAPQGRLHRAAADPHQARRRLRPAPASRDLVSRPAGRMPRVRQTTAGLTVHRWLQRMPLTHRLVLILVVLMAGALTLTTSATTWLLERQLLQRADQELRLSAGPLSASALDAIANEQELDNFPTNYAVVFFPKGSSNQIVFQPQTEEEHPDIPRLAMDAPEVRTHQIFEVRSKDGYQRWRVVADKLDGDSGTYAVAVSMRGVEKTTSQVMLFSLLIGLAAVTALMIAGWFAIRRAFRPLRQIEDTAKAIAGGDLARRVPARSADDEVGSLSDSLNVMLSHIERSFQHVEASETRMRQFVADASHELRTPLAAVRGYAELYRQGAVTQPEHVRQVFQRIEDESTRMGALVEDLLSLARLGVAVEIQMVGLHGPIDANLVRGDESKLRQLVTNLVGNAINHTPAGTPIELVVGHGDGGDRQDGDGLEGDGQDGDGWTTIEIRDHGPGIDPELSGKVFERFFRNDPSRGRTDHPGGTGLGLAIVAAITGAHHGDVTIVPTPGGGATFRVRLPTDPQQSHSDAPASA